ncbi:MAG: hypothetical protein EPN41_12215 [Candidimonas sp.]|nr:MAG: hypothetical protein EPN41_12215 [Candidimonas sp.]
MPEAHWLLAEDDRRGLLAVAVLLKEPFRDLEAPVLAQVHLLDSGDHTLHPFVNDCAMFVV